MPRTGRGRQKRPEGAQLQLAEVEKNEDEESRGQVEREGRL